MSQRCRVLILGDALDHAMRPLEAFVDLAELQLPSPLLGQCRVSLRRFGRSNMRQSVGVSNFLRRPGLLDDAELRTVVLCARLLTALLLCDDRRRTHP